MPHPPLNSKRPNVCLYYRSVWIESMLMYICGGLFIARVVYVNLRTCICSMVYGRICRSGCFRTCMQYVTYYIYICVYRQNPCSCVYVVYLYMTVRSMRRHTCVYTYIFNIFMHVKIFFCSLNITAVSLASVFLLLKYIQICTKSSPNPPLLVQFQRFYKLQELAQMFTSV